MPLSSRRKAALGLLLASAAAIALPKASRADSATLTPEQRQSLDRAIELWGMGLFGGEHGAPYTAVADGDHYRLEVPLDRPIGHTGARIEGDAMTASATSLDGGRWAFDNVQSPASIRFIPAPSPDGSTGDSVSLAQQTARRDSHVVIDPSLATISSFDGTAEGVVVGVALPSRSLDIKADRSTSHAAWQPAAAGRVDVTSTSAADGVTYQMSGQMPGKTPDDAGFRMTARRLTSASHAAGFAPQRLADAVRSGLQILETASADAIQAPAAPAAKTPPNTGGGASPAGPATRPARGPVPKLDAAQRALLHGMLDAMRDAYGGLSQDIAAEGVDFAVHDHHVTLDKMAVSQSFAAPGGRADVRMRVALDGIASPDIPPGVLRDLLPRHVVLAPHFAGLAVADTFAMISKAIDSDDPKLEDLAPDGATALSKSPVTSGLDELSFDLGPAKLTASGDVRTAGPQDVVGSADVKVTGLDALIKLASDDPLLQQGAPVLIFLKGIGRQDGDVVTWKVAFANQKLTVNGTDMSQLVPAGK